MGGRTLKALIPIRKRKSCWIFYTAIDMKTDLIFFIAIFVIAVLFIGHFRLTFSPFSISLPYWHRALGQARVGSRLFKTAEPHGHIVWRCAERDGAGGYEAVLHVIVVRDQAVACGHTPQQAHRLPRLSVRTVRRTAESCPAKAPTLHRSRRRPPLPPLQQPVRTVHSRRTSIL